MSYKTGCVVIASVSLLLALGCSKPQLMPITQECDGPSPAVEAKTPPELQLKGDSLETYQSAKAKIETREKYHNAVLDYERYTTPYSFFLVGIEKPRGNTGVLIANPVIRHALFLKLIPAGSKAVHKTIKEKSRTRRTT